MPHVPHRAGSCLATGLATGLAIGLAIGLLAAACDAAVVPPGTPLATQQEMIRNNGIEPESLDPALVESALAGNILVDLFEGLTAIDNHGKVVPGIAQSWRQTDATTWRFTLRPTARWSNGDPVTAQDFVYAWRRFVDPRTAAPLAGDLGLYVRNGTAIVLGKRPVADLGVRAIDAMTLEVQTEGVVPFLPFIVGFGQLAPVPHGAIEKFGRDWTKPGHLVSDGAYVLKDWQVNNKVVLEKNAAYWDAANVQLTRVTYLPVEDASADLKLYQSGAEDFTQRVPSGSYAALKATSPHELHNSLLIAAMYYALNNRDPLLKDVRVRQALTMVIDRDILAGKVTADGELPLYGLGVKGSEGVDVVRYEWADWPMDKRVAAARALLAQAGVRAGTRLKFAYDNGDTRKKTALFVASEWKTKLGLDTELESMEYKVLYRRRMNAEYQVARDGFIPGFADITGFLTAVQCDDPQNDNKNCNPAADALMRQGSASTDAVKRQALMTQAMRMEMADYPQIPLLQMSMPRLVKPWIGGYEDLNDQDSYRSKDLFVIRH